MGKRKYATEEERREAARLRLAKYRASAKGKAAWKRWNASAAGKAANKRAKEKAKLSGRERVLRSLRMAANPAKAAQWADYVASQVERRERGD